MRHMVAGATAEAMGRDSGTATTPVQDDLVKVLFRTGRDLAQALQEAKEHPVSFRCGERQPLIQTVSETARAIAANGQPD